MNGEKWLDEMQEKILDVVRVGFWWRHTRNDSADGNADYCALEQKQRWPKDCFGVFSRLPIKTARQ